jgi:hypothetical protein
MTSLTLAQLAEITLRIERGEPRDAVLARQGISEESWLSGQAEWFALMSTQAQRQRHVLFQRYLAARAAAERRLEEPPQLNRVDGPAEGAPHALGGPAASAPLRVSGEVPALPPAPLYAMTSAPVRAAPASIAPEPAPSIERAWPEPQHAEPAWPEPQHAEPAWPEPQHAEPAWPRQQAQPAAALAAPARFVPAPAEPQLAVQQLAGLVAELTVFPERTAAALADVGLDRAGWETEWAAWQSRFVYAPEQRREYESLVGYYSGLFRSRPR